MLLLWASSLPTRCDCSFPVTPFVPLVPVYLCLGIFPSIVIWELGPFSHRDPAPSLAPGLLGHREIPAEGAVERVDPGLQPKRHTLAVGVHGMLALSTVLPRGFGGFPGASGPGCPLLS